MDDQGDNKKEEEVTDQVPEPDQATASTDTGQTSDQPNADDTDEDAGDDQQVLGLGDDSSQPPSEEDAKEKADEKSGDEACEFC